MKTSLEWKNATTVSVAVLLAFLAMCLFTECAHAASPFAQSEVRDKEQVIALFRTCEEGDKKCDLNEPVASYRKRLEDEYLVAFKEGELLSEIFTRATSASCEEVFGKTAHAWAALNKKTGGTVQGAQRNCREKELVFFLPTISNGMVLISSDCLNMSPLLPPPRKASAPPSYTMWCKKKRVEAETAPFQGGLYENCLL